MLEASTMRAEDVRTDSMKEPEGGKGTVEGGMV
jgi:hypothetical protein